MSGLKKGFDSLLKNISSYEINENNVKKAVKEFKFLLLQNDVSLSVANQISKELTAKMKGKRAKRFSNMSESVKEFGKEIIIDLITPKKSIDIVDILKHRREESRKLGKREPFVVLFLGVNGTGKTTTIAKLASILKKAGFLVILAACDTFRSGAQEQLKVHADKVGVKLIQGKYGGDSAAVAYDAIAHAKSKYADIVLIDTAGRMATNKDLMGEMAKIKRVTSPDLIILVVDALAGNDATNQAKDFNEGISIDGIVISKMDADAKGGALISVTRVTNGVPVCYIGVGQKYNDLELYDPNKFMKQMFQ